MAKQTIQVADKPTLDEVAEKVTEIKSAMENGGEVGEFHTGTGKYAFSGKGCVHVYTYQSGYVVGVKDLVIDGINHFNSDDSNKINHSFIVSSPSSSGAIYYRIPFKKSISFSLSCYNQACEVSVIYN